MVTLHYTLKTEQGSFLDDFTVGEQNFENVVSSKILLSVSADTNYNGLPIQILNEQQVVVSTNYYVKDIGLIKSENTYNYRYTQNNQITETLEPIHIETSQTIESYSGE